ncbi:type 4 pilus major pilin [Tistlia consotensis]|nr:type 4 pilus major pilin [Tistlia consotensis]
MIIAGIVIAGVGYEMSKALAGNDTQELASNLTQMVNDTQALYTGAAGYTGLSNSQLLSADAVPVGMQRSDGSGGTDVVSPWGTVTVAANTSDATRFDVALATVPTANCIKLLGSVNKAVDAAEVGSTALTLPLDLSAATTACGASDSQTVTLTYR